MSLKPPIRTWVTWENHRRSKELSSAFDCTYLSYEPSGMGTLKRYISSAFKTIRAFYKNRPTTIFVQCPSLVLAILISLLRRIYKFVFIIDAHNALPNYEKSGNWIFRGLAKFSISTADYVIVTNSKLEKPIKTLGGNALILPDKLPHIAVRQKPSILKTIETPVIVVISSFAWDEPTEKLLQALTNITLPFHSFVTGKKAKAHDLLKFESDKIHFTDFISDEEFEALLQHASLAVDLTTDDRILVCGAYEAVAVGVPALLSDSEVTRQLFRKGVLYAKDSVEAYQHSIETFLTNPGNLKSQMAEFQPEFKQTWSANFSKVNQAIQQAEASLPPASFPRVPEQ